MKILITLFVGLGCLVPAIYFLQLRSFKRRSNYDREDILRAYGVGEDDYDFLVRILSAVGKSYRIDYRKLRPADSFDRNLKHLDSWVLDAGNEQLSGVLQGLGVAQFDNLHTVKDIVTACLKKK